jgi:hypothetical protein
VADDSLSYFFFLAVFFGAAFLVAFFAAFFLAGILSIPLLVGFWPVLATFNISGHKALRILAVAYERHPPLSRLFFISVAPFHTVRGA